MRILALLALLLLIGCPRHDPNGPTSQPRCPFGFGEGCDSK